MQTYLCIGDFRQRLNKAGQPYGLQYLLMVGESELDDQIANTLGAGIGALYLLLSERIKRNLQETPHPC